MNNPQSKTARVALTGAFLLAIAAGPQARADYRSLVLAQGPAAYYRLN
jgi:hypothetical protein